MEQISIIEDIKVLSMAMYGAIVNVLSAKKVPTGQKLIIELSKAVLIGGFVGLIAYNLASFQKLGSSATNILVGIAGYMGARFLQLAEDFIKRRYNVDVSAKSLDDGSN